MRKFLFLLALMLAAPVAAARDWPRLPVPGGAKLVWVSGVVQANGFMQRVASLSSDRPPQEIVAFYRTRWAAPQYLDGHKLPGYLVKSAPPWEVISRLHNGYMIAIQLRRTAMGGTQGEVSISDLSQRPSLAPSPFPMPSGSHVLNDLPSNDGGRQARTLTLTNNASIASNVSFYEQYFKQRGWRLVVSKSDDSGRAYVLILEQGARSANFFLQSSSTGATVVMANLMGSMEAPQ